MFVDDKENIKITIYYKQFKGGKIAVAIKLDDVPAAERGDFKPVHVEMRSISWGAQNNILRQSTVRDPLTMTERTDWISFKEKRLINLLVKWDAKTADGRDVPLAPENIMKLHPLIAETILGEYDRQVYGAGADEGGTEASAEAPQVPK